MLQKVFFTNLILPYYSQANLCYYFETIVVKFEFRYQAANSRSFKQIPRGTNVYHNGLCNWYGHKCHVANERTAQRREENAQKAQQAQAAAAEPANQAKLEQKRQYNQQLRLTKKIEKQQALAAQNNVPQPQQQNDASNNIEQLLRNAGKEPHDNIDIDIDGSSFNNNIKIPSGNASSSKEHSAPFAQAGSSASKLPVCHSGTKQPEHHRAFNNSGDDSFSGPMPDGSASSSSGLFNKEGGF